MCVAITIAIAIATIRGAVIDQLASHFIKLYNYSYSYTVRVAIVMIMIVIQG